MKGPRLLLTIIIVSCLLSACDISRDLGKKEDYIMNKYQQWQWKDAGATASYNIFTREVVIEKSVPEPAWGGSILELGTTDLAKDYYLKFKVTDLRGLYAVSIHYGGWANYENNSIKIQYDTTMMGEQEYNVSEALRMQGLTGKQQVAMKIYVIDPNGEQGTARLHLKGLSFTAR
jgi:hypothetical protein